MKSKVFHQKENRKNQKLYFSRNLAFYIIDLNSKFPQWMDYSLKIKWILKKIKKLECFL